MEGTKIIDPKNISGKDLHGYLLGAVAPRPIAYVSTIGPNGQANLSPYSFFNAFGTNPPTLIFSPGRRGRDNTLKDTYQNLRQHPEVVVNIVSHAMVEQMSLSSAEYPSHVNEFEKAGFTQAPSVKVAPPRVAQSPAAFECKVTHVIPTGTQGGAGNLVICQVLLMHFHDNVLDANQKIDPFKLDAVGRMGGNWYVRANGAALFEVERPNQNLGVGVDSMPESIRLSPVLTGNNLGRLGNASQLPTPEQTQAYGQEAPVAAILNNAQLQAPQKVQQLHQLAHQMLENQQSTQDAWKVLLLAHDLA